MIIITLVLAFSLNAHAHDVPGKVTGDSGSVTINITPSGESHKLSKTGDEITWTYTQGEKTTDLSSNASHIWYGMIALGVAKMPNQASLPGFTPKSATNSVTYQFQVTVDEVSTSYSYSDPASYSGTENAQVASMISLLGGIAQQETLTEESWRQRKIRERDQRVDRLDSYVGKTIKKMESSARGTLYNVQVLRRKGDHYIVQHSRGSLRIEATELIEAIDGKK